MAKTLIIHPTDKSTDFLKPIYENIQYKTVVNKGISIKEHTDELSSHNRIMMMGHGCPIGLFAMGLFNKGYGMAIGSSDVKHLKGKDNVYIWCNANEFVEHHGLAGFYSGMFISEVGEARAMGVADIFTDGVVESMVEQSNNVFARIMSTCAHLPSYMIYETVKEQYGNLAQTNPVAQYNHERLYYSDGKSDCSGQSIDNFFASLN